MKLTIIITCYNQENFIEEAINSAIHQKFDQKQIIVIDNGSVDGSKEKILKAKLTFPNIESIFFEDSINYCKAFNIGLKKATGEFIVDLSGDDILLPEFAQKAIESAQTLPEAYGVFYCNAEYIDETGNTLQYHFPKSGAKSRLSFPAPSGDIYSLLLEKFIIAAPSMLIKREVFNSLDGYDEVLAYEDFDFWIRSSRKWKYHYIDHIGVRIRKHQNNFGKQFASKNQNAIMWSTFKVCLKAKNLNQSEVENEALHKRCSYHMRQAVLTEHFILAKKYFALIKSVSKPSFRDYLFLGLAFLQWPVYPFYRMYIKNH